MKTFEEWCKEAEQTHSEVFDKYDLLALGWSAAIEAMRQDCEPVDVVVIGSIADRKYGVPLGTPLYTRPQPLRELSRQDCEPVAWMNKSGSVLSAAEKANLISYKGLGGEFECAARTGESYSIPLTHPQPLRELSREEIMKLWDRAWEESGSVHQVEHFAKLVRSAK